MDSFDRLLSKLGFKEGEDWINFSDGSMLISIDAKQKLREVLRQALLSDDCADLLNLLRSIDVNG